MQKQVQVSTCNKNYKGNIMIVEQKLKDIQTRFADIEAQMNSGNVGCLYTGTGC